MANDSLSAAVQAALGKTGGAAASGATPVRQVESGALKSSSKSGSIVED